MSWKRSEADFPIDVDERKTAAFTSMVELSSDERTHGFVNEVVGAYIGAHAMQPKSLRGSHNVSTIKDGLAPACITFGGFAIDRAWNRFCFSLTCVHAWRRTTFLKRHHKIFYKKTTV